jgi:hypothetical protein
LVGETIDWEAIRATAKPDELSTEQWNALFDEMTADLGDNWSEVAQTLANDSLGWLHDLDSPLFPREAGIGLRPALLDAVYRAETALEWNADVFALTPGRYSAPSRPGRILPLIVTIANYQGTGARNLPGARVDYRNIHGLLTKRFQVHHTRIWFDSDAVHRPGQPSVTPTITRTRAAVRTMAQRAGPDDTVFIYLSGHGIRPKNHSLGGLLYRSGREYLWSALLRDIGYADPTNNVPTRAGHIVIVADLCMSGSLIQRVYLFDDLPGNVKWRVSVFAASGPDQPAEDSNAAGAFYTYHFIKAFLDDKTDTNRDGVITAMEAAAAIPADVGPRGRKQNPDFYAARDAPVPLRHLRDPAGKVKDGTSAALKLQAPSAVRGPVRFKGRSGAPSDPNDKLAPGHGESGWIAPDERSVYTVHFENIAPEGVPVELILPAQTVVVTDQLSADLDWSTFELEAIGFNNTVIHIPPGRMIYETIATVATDANRVAVGAELDAGSGLITWRMQSFDDQTGLLPEDPWAGFLPVNDETRAGEGYVTFAISPKPSLQDATEIYNQASIVFDVNDPILTNVVTNTIDDNLPTSSVNPLPAESESPLTVSWSGDDGSGSGIAFYDVYLSTDGGWFLAWQSGITETQTVFSGTVGSSYGFNCVAVDNVGHRESTPAAAQATVTIIEGDRTIYLPVVLRN